MDIKKILSTIFILFLKIITLFGIIVVLLYVLVLIIFIIFPFLFSPYKVAIQDTWIYGEREGEKPDIKKGDLCRFHYIGNGVNKSEVECKSGIKGYINDYDIEKYFVDI